ncbi:hypothetical protein BH09MYX1_BH09MYX1_29710 [soil metagenome]
MKRWLGMLTLALVACSGPGPYGYARTYRPIAGEEAATRNAKAFDSAMLTEPGRFADVPLNIFGVVRQRGSASTKGHVYLTLSVRRLDDRNLCASANDERTCRLTVSDVSFGEVAVLIELSPEDDEGEHAVGPGSLLRIIGVLGSDFDSVGGGPIVHGTWYRHWPRGQFVTRAQATELRQ